MRTIHIISFITIFSFLVTSCSDENPDAFIKDEQEILAEVLNLPEQTLDYSIELPQHIRHLFPETIDNQNDLAKNKRATLGRVLFYDTRLSANNTVSCATCHDPKLGFGDNKALSEGFDGQLGHRNSIALATTVGFETSYGGERAPGDENNFVDFAPVVQFAWDDMTPDIMEQSRLAIESELEMGMKMDEVVDRLKKEPFYGILFRNVFGTVEIQDVMILEALQEFINSIGSVNTKFDRAMDAQGLPEPSPDFLEFTDEENLGKRLFNDNCTTCHSHNHALPAAIVGNNGLDLVYADNGKGEKTGLESEMGLFKVPFLRNVALSAPYMHDGRFATLEEVLDHYATEIKNHPNLSPELKEYTPAFPEGKPRQFNFTQEEKDAIIAYLHTLTDETIATAEKFSDPFKR